MRRARRLLFVAAAAGLALAVVDAAPAYAHAELEASDPQAGAVYDQPPQAVTLSYSEPVEATFGAVRVYDGGGDRLDTGSASHPDGDGRRVRVDLSDLEDGSYVVTWRVLSADSHPVQGAFTFQVGPEASAEDIEGLAERLLAAQGGTTSVGALYAVARAGVFVGLALLVGGVAFVAVLWARGRESSRTRGLVWAGWVVTVAATAVGLALEGPYAAGLPLGDALEPDVLSEVVDTRFGKVWLARLALLVVAIPLLRRLFPASRPVAEYPLGPGWRGAALAAGAGLVLTPGVAGHAGSGELVPLAVVADGVHVGAMALWLGGLAVLVVAMLPAGDATELRAVVPRYSQLALVSVTALVVTGAFQSWRQVGGLSALRDTDFGRLLVIKLLLFGTLVVVAAFSREVVNRRFRARTAARYAERVAVGGGPGDGGDAFVDADLDDATEVRNLRRSAGVEIAIAVVILVVAALLVNTPPGRSDASGPFAEILKSEELWVDVLVDPARVGANEVHVTALEPGGSPAEVLELEVQMTLPDRDIAAIDVPLQRLGPGHYVSTEFTIPIKGDWTMIANALVTETDQVVVKGEVTIR